MLEVMWVVSMGDMLSIARIPDKHVLRVVVQPCITQQKISKWLVIFSAPMAKEDVEPWRARKLWQNRGPEDERQKRAVEEIVTFTPKTKVIIGNSTVSQPSHVIT